MKTTQPTKKFIALVDKLQPLTVREYDAPDIKITIAVLGEDGKPRNWSHGYEEPKTSTGGCFCRLWATKLSEGPKVIISAYGPEISYGARADYKHAARAMDLIAKRGEKIHKARGNAADAADELGRWLETCGVTEVYSRPAGDRNEWLTKGEWEVWNIGRTIYEVRNLFPKAENNVKEVLT